jgi:threonine dehydratase
MQRVPVSLMRIPITLNDVLEAETRIRPFLPQTALRHYAPLDDALGAGMRVYVKHENHQPTNSFKVRNALAALTLLSPALRNRGVVTASRGNHGQALAWAGAQIGARVTVCVPLGNSPGKNAAMRGYGATLIEAGRDYDEALEIAHEHARAHGEHMVHSTNDRAVVAGAGTIARELIEQAPELDALVVGVGGGSQAVGALAALRALAPRVALFGVQAEGAAAIAAGFASRMPREVPSANTFADGLATRRCYELTFDALCDGVTDFVTVSDAEIANALRVLLETTHNLAEGAGAAPLAGLFKLRERLAGKSVAIVMSGGNIDEAVLRRVLNREI